MSWESGFNALAQEYRQIMAQVSQRSQTQRSSHAYADFTRSIRSDITAWARQLQTLEHHSEVGVTQGEKERRRNLVQSLKVKESALRDLMDQVSPTSKAQRNQLLEGSVPALDGAGAGWSGVGASGGADALDGYRGGGDAEGQTAAQLKLAQEEILEVQNEGLDALHEVIVRQKRMARAIGGEVEVQNEILDDIGDAMDQTNERLLTTTQSIRNVDRRDRTCKYWTVILLLLIPIVILLLI